MQTTKMDVSLLKENPDNPRAITDQKFQALVKSVKEVPVIDCSDLTEEQQREFVIKDNVGFGEWEWDKIISDWPEAVEWGPPNTAK